jgi:hypothetical protein
MKIFFCVILGLTILSGMLSCKKEKTESKEASEIEEVEQAVEEKTTSEFTLPELDNDYLVSVYETQELIKMDHDNIELRKKYCQMSYFKEHGVFVSMGIAKLYNPRDGSAIARQFVERAAKLDAIRWAMYGESWIKNNFEPSFGKIANATSHPTQIINTASVGDSLFVFLATKMP